MSHLYLDVTQYGSIKLNRPDIEPWQMNESCALDVADRGKHSLVVTGKYFGISGERIRQVIDIVMEKLITDFNIDQKVA